MPEMIAERYAEIAAGLRRLEAERRPAIAGEVAAAQTVGLTLDGKAVGSSLAAHLRWLAEGGVYLGFAPVVHGRA